MTDQNSNILLDSDNNSTQITDDNLYILLDSDNNLKIRIINNDIQLKHKIKHGINKSNPVLVLIKDNDIEHFRTHYGNDNIIVKEMSEIDVKKAVNYVSMEIFEDVVPIYINNPESFSLFEKIHSLHYIYDEYLLKKMYELIFEKV